MKKIIYFLFLILFTTSNAQTIAETVDWLNTKKSEITSTQSKKIAKGVNIGVTFTNQMIKIQNNYDVTSFKWSKIVDFRINNDKEDPSLYLVSDEMDKGLPLFIVLKFKTIEVRDRFRKAIKNITSINGNEIVDSSSDSDEDNIKWLNAKGIDVFDGDSQLRVNYSKSGIKMYYLEDSETFNIKWENIKNLSFKLYDKNKDYYQILIKSSDSSSGSAVEKKLFIYKSVGATYGKMLKSIALRKGAKFIDDDLF